MNYIASEADRDAISRTVKAVLGPAAAAKMGRGGGPQTPARRGGGGEWRFRAKITAVSGSFPSWDYTVQQVVGYDASATGHAKWVTDGVNITGVKNAMEAGPTSGYPYTYPIGVTITDSDGTVNDGDCKIQPIAVGAVVDVDVIYDTSFEPVFSFCVPNSAEEF